MGHDDLYWQNQFRLWAVESLFGLFAILLPLIMIMGAGVIFNYLESRDLASVGIGIGWLAFVALWIWLVVYAVRGKKEAEIKIREIENR